MTRLFATLFAVALLLHQAWWDGFEVSGWHGAVVLTAVVVLARPTVPWLLLMLFCEVVAVWRDMPGAGSHTVLGAVCAAAIVLWAAAFALGRRRLPSEDELWTAVAPFLRGAVVVLYLFAALAKLNPGYFDAAVSCGAALAPRVAWFDPSLLDHGWMRTLGIYGSVLAECSLPVLLLVRRTRPVGVALGVSFHTVLALAGNVPFSALMLALYVAFLPPSAWRALPFWLASALAAGWVALHVLEPSQEAIGWGTRLAFLAAVAWAALRGVLRGVRPRAGTAPEVRRDSADPRRGLMSAEFLRGVRPRAGTAQKGARKTHPVLVAGLALLVLNGLSPYLGLKTESAFAMYSNLQTEAGSWNHVLVPEAVRVFDFQDDLVTVTASSDPALVRRTRGGTKIVRFELERYLRLHPGTRASVGGEELVADGGPRLVDKLAKFRDVRPRARRGC